jgi:hypothetical protein
MVLSRPAASLSLKFEFLNARAALKILPLSSRGGAKTPGVGWPKSPVALTAKTDVDADSTFRAARLPPPAKRGAMTATRRYACAEQGFGGAVSLSVSCWPSHQCAGNDRSTHATPVTVRKHIEVKRHDKPI